ncbi:MAG: S8 family serine peptidase [Bdellovibrio sp.]|nr:S8 family serine peptidase [Bdellovibrio sp.]
MRRMSYFSVLTFLSTFLLLTLGCSQKKAESLSFKASDIWSNRPQNRDRLMAIVRLSEPALLEKAHLEEGRLIVAPEAKEALLVEQANKEEELKALSSEIKIFYRYRWALNALAIIVPVALEDKIKGMEGVSYIEREGFFGRPILASQNGVTKGDEDITQINSVSFIGADRVHKELGITGKGVKVGIIDTGIDYTHSMFKGLGTKEAYKNINPSGLPVGFPSEKVAGGIDLVGTAYNAASPIFEKRLPIPDQNPLDEGGHGTHVAGTVAGIGDGVKHYSGVAPDATLYAIKVFGADGSTSDSVVIAALEYSVDPNGDLNADDRLDVVNLSLGSSYGKAHILYSEAIKNLTTGGIAVSASAGNSGHSAYIVGSPSTSDAALSVAASIDNMAHNWQFDGIKFLGGQLDVLVEAIEGSMTLPLSKVQNLKEELVAVGTLKEEISDELKSRLKGKIALIDRGDITFVEKFKKVIEYGAIAVVMANNRPGEPFRMGGDESIAIPGIMIDFELGKKIKEQLSAGSVVADLTSGERIKKPEMIDTLTDFSSQGPRSIDGAFKPEVALPGANIISAAMGEGSESTMMSGTSMAAPHMSGVFALLKQSLPSFRVEELKALVMGQAKTMKDANGKLALWSEQGAGRVDAYLSLKAAAYFIPSGFSLGEMQVLRRKKLSGEVVFKNISNRTLNVKFESSQSDDLGLEVQAPNTIAAGQTVKLKIYSTLRAPREQSAELNGIILAKDADNDAILARLPVMALVTRGDALKQQGLNVFASSEEDEADALAQLKIQNAGPVEGEAYLFNYLGKDSELPIESGINSTRSRLCDLQSAGYRIVNRENERLLQFAVKLYTPVTRWQGCELSILIDGNGDGSPDQELAGILGDNLSGLDGKDYQSVLLDVDLVQKLRKEYEEAHARGEVAVKENYSAAILEKRPMRAFNQSSLSIVEISLDRIFISPVGELKFKLQVLNEDQSSREGDDMLGENAWKSVMLSDGGQGLLMIPEVIKVPGQTTQEIDLKLGARPEKIIIYYPYNSWSKVPGVRDQQSEIVQKKYIYAAP